MSSRRGFLPRKLKSEVCWLRSAVRGPRSVLERCGHGEAKRLSQLSQKKLWCKCGDRIVEGKVACRLVAASRRIGTWGAGEHTASDGYRRRSGRIQPQRVIRPVNAKGSVDDRQKYLQFHSGGHPRNPVGVAQNLQQLGECLLASPDTVQGNIQVRTAKNCVLDVAKLPRVNAQLRVPKNGIHAYIHKRRQGNRPGNGDPVLHVGHQVEIAAGEDNLFQRDRNGVVTAEWIAGILGDGGAIGVSQRDDALVRQKGDRSDGADVEAAQVVFSARIEALKGWRDHAAVAGQEGSLEIQANRIVLVLHREETLVLHDGT